MHWDMKTYQTSRLHVADEHLVRCHFGHPLQGLVRSASRGEMPVLCDEGVQNESEMFVRLAT